MFQDSRITTSVAINMILDQFFFKLLSASLFLAFVPVHSERVIVFAT